MSEVPDDDPRKANNTEKKEKKGGTLLTELNNYGIEVRIPECKTLREVLCPARQDLMLLGPFTMLSFVGLKSAGS